MLKKRSTRLLPTIFFVATLGLSACAQKVVIAVEGQTYIAGVGAKLVTYSSDLRTKRVCPVPEGTVALGVRQTYVQESGFDKISTVQVAHDGLPCSGIVPNDYIEGDSNEAGWKEITDPTASYEATTKICNNKQMRGLNPEAILVCSKLGFKK